MQTSNHLRLVCVFASLFQLFEAVRADDQAGQNAPDVAEGGKSEANEPLVPSEVGGFEETVLRFAFAVSARVYQHVQDFNDENQLEFVLR